MVKDNAHSILLKNEIIELSHYPDKFWVWRNETGTGLSMDGKRVIRYGAKGTPDIIGFTSSGKFLGIEIKTGGGVQSQIQKNFERISKEFNCYYFVIRDLEEIKKAIAENGLL